MHRLWGYIVRYRARYMRGIICLVVSATLAMSIPLGHLARYLEQKWGKAE